VVRSTVTRRGFREFHVSVVFRAPVGFVYSWCTDYSSDDAKITGEDKMFHLRRKIVQKSARQVVFENIYDEGRGWAWERHTVTLRPPDRWHSDGFGNYQESHLDYRLTELPRDRTRLTMRWRSRSSSLASGERPSKAAIERFVLRLWQRRGRVLTRDYEESIEQRRGRLHG
jgi:hypothetical protein